MRPVSPGHAQGAGRPQEVSNAMEQASMNLLRGDHALVTGAASGIGRAIAVTLAREGASVVLADIVADRNASVAREIADAGGSTEAVTADLSTRDGWRGLLDGFGDRLPSIFVHAACPPRHEADTPLAVAEEIFDAMITTNIRSGFFLGRELGRRMKAEKVSGRMLFVTSLHAQSPRNLPHYSAGKAGMTMVMKELARELGPAGIRVNALAPGAVPGGGAEIPASFADKIPMRRTGSPDDLAGMALALLADRFSRYVTGTTIVVDGGISLYNWIPFTED